ncbi:MAG: endonuclease III domain-containing protein [Deltaproteobacteria bacterium]|nr:endonuclease III domain-containing protein [Deltaproteobacteria bacterium]
MRNRLMEMFNLMLVQFGPQHWWPGDGPFEMMVGAMLTQNTSWTNVEKAINNLKVMNLLTVEAIHEIPVERLADIVRPAGYYNIKASRLKNLVNMLMERYGGNIFRLFDEDMDAQRTTLLSVKGIGPETADSIILYAAKKPIFVIDAYTHRILNRHNMADDQAAYDEMQDIFMSSLEPDHNLFNEFHALIVRTAKLYCRKIPQCDKCPLDGWEKG